MADAPFVTGQLLLAMPGMADPRFTKAVIAVCGHNEDGAMGVGVGAPLREIRLPELLEKLDVPRGDVPDAPVFRGGPVEPTRGFVLHTSDWSGQDTVDVAGHWGLTGTLDILKAIAERKGPSRWIVALGYAGWGAGQLDDEMTVHGWLTLPHDPAILWGPEVGRWDRALSSAGIDPRLLSPTGGRA